MIELLPCPFCGGEAHVFSGDGVKVVCDTCFNQTMARTDLSYSNSGKNNALEAVIEAWNRRPTGLRPSYFEGEWYCGNCHKNSLFKGDKFCHECGWQVNWDE